MTKNDLEYLDELNERELPVFLKELSDEKAQALREYIEYSIELRTAGLDRFYEMAAKVSKYVPNFILQNPKHKAGLKRLQTLFGIH